MRAKGLSSENNNNVHLVIFLPVTLYLIKYKTIMFSYIEKRRYIQWLYNIYDEVIFILNLAVNIINFNKNYSFCNKRKYDLQCNTFIKIKKIYLKI